MSQDRLNPKGAVSRKLYIEIERRWWGRKKSPNQKVTVEYYSIVSKVSAENKLIKRAALSSNWIYKDANLL